jgi:hypothetical protein
MRVVGVLWTLVGVGLLGSCSLFGGVEGLWCDRTPTGVTVPKTPGGNGFKIIISGDPDKPDKYIPGAQYTGKEKQIA